MAGQTRSQRAAVDVTAPERSPLPLRGRGWSTCPECGRIYGYRKMPRHRRQEHGVLSTSGESEAGKLVIRKRNELIAARKAREEAAVRRRFEAYRDRWKREAQHARASRVAGRPDLRDRFLAIVERVTAAREDRTPRDLEETPKTRAYKRQPAPHWG